jgi:CheY-like chemotaxis protein
MNDMKKLLIIEDDANTRLGLLDLLQQEGYWGIGARNGRDAVEILGHTAFDAALCDYKLPDFTGLQICQKLRRLQPGLALFLITAYNHSELAQAAQMSGIRGVLNKPLNLELLFSTLHELPEIAFTTAPQS